MVNDLIERQAAIDALERIFDRCEEIEAHLPGGDPDRVGYKMYPDWLTVWKYLHQVPSAQTEIIHCEHCKNWQTGWRNREWGLGYHWCSYVDGVRRSDWFCADAERREDDKQ